MVLVTVVVPAYNEETLIGATLEALLADQSVSIRVIVVANGCTDRTAEIARCYEVEVIELPQSGVSRARNVGASRADSEYVLFLDADISPDPGFLAGLVERATATGAATVLADFRPDVSGWKARVFLWLHNWGHRLYHAPMGFIFTRRDVFGRVGGFDERLAKGEDIKYVHQSLRFGSFAYVCHPCAMMSMRRFEQWGYLYTTLYWIFGALFPDAHYPAVR